MIPGYQLASMSKNCDLNIIALFETKTNVWDDVYLGRVVFVSCSQFVYGGLCYSVQHELGIEQMRRVLPYQGSKFA